MVYAISQDMTEIYKEPDKWENHGRRVIESSCNHHSIETSEDNNITYFGYCDECDFHEDSCIPMMNYLYPLELNNFDDDKILKVIQETNMTVLENTEENVWYLALCGGGMNLSQDIALAYFILENWIPEELIKQVCKQRGFNISIENYNILAKAIIDQCRKYELNLKQTRKEWIERLKESKEKEAQK